MTVGAEQVVLEILKVAIATGGPLVEMITEKERAELEERIRRAELAIKDPIDTTGDDAARRARLEAVLRGDPATRPTEPPAPIPSPAERPTLSRRAVRREDIEAIRRAIAQPGLLEPKTVAGLNALLDEETAKLPSANPYPDVGSE